jgi:two-component system sensor histidine kinase BaeS
MKISISSKLFLAVLSTALFVTLAMGAADSVSFVRGFLGYINEMATQRMTAVQPRFVASYQEHGGWEQLRGNRAAWFQLLRPPAELQRQTVDDNSSPMLVSDLTGAVFRIALLDAQQQHVMGFRGLSPTKEDVRQPIRVNGETVGWLSMTPFQSATEAGADRFIRNQLLASALIGAIAVLLATLIAWWVSRHLLAPVKRVAAATHRLAAGDYAERVCVDSPDEVGQLARDFNQLAHTLERNEAMRRAFMADVSHELRTPLAVLRGELEAIEDGVRQLDNDSMKSLQAEVSMLSKLVDDLYELSLADVGALTYRKTPLDLLEQVQLSVAVFRERFAEHGLSLELNAPSTPLLLLADGGRLQQLFSNLLENSVRYTQAGGGLQINLKATGDALTIDFIDSAPGVTPEQLPHLFERFYRGEASRSRASGGAGLGLAICHSIVEAHNGSISARASELGGLWLSIQLPKGPHANEP